MKVSDNSNDITVRAQVNSSLFMSESGEAENYEISSQVANKDSQKQQKMLSNPI